LGEVKTRLAKESSQFFSLTLYSSMLQDTLERLNDFENQKRLLLADCSLKEAERFRSDHALPGGFRLGIQEGKDLGERMFNACVKYSIPSGGAIFLGTDSPSLPLKQIREANRFTRLGQTVIGPTIDGGYYLIGIPECWQQLFYNIPWGSDKVLESTLKKLEKSQFHLLEEWYDIDSYQDLGYLCRDLQCRFPGYPQRTADFLRRKGLL
jgi:rSAM/selenodomain-associated transferase 1